MSDRAYKVKQPVDVGFPDFRTRQRRVNGRKPLWAAVIAVHFVGPVARLLWDRAKTKAPRPVSRPALPVAHQGPCCAVCGGAGLKV